MPEYEQKCPFCTSLNVHIESVKVNRGGEITEISKAGTHLTSGEASGRGALVAVTMWCEEGHKWIHKMQFHKGTVSISDEILIAGDPSWPDFTHDLWRD